MVITHKPFNDSICDIPLKRKQISLLTSTILYMKQVSVKKALKVWQEIQPISERDRERLSRRFTIDYNYI